MGNIIEITHDDVETLVDLARRTFYQTFGEFYEDKDLQQFFDKSYTAEAFHQELDNEDSFHYFYQEDNEIVGYLKLNINQAQTEKMGSEYLEIQRIYFDENYQGRGGGSAFMAKAEAQARLFNKSKIWLGVWEHNPKAITFYENKGFSIVGEHHFHTGDVVDTDLIMEKSLNVDSK